MTLGVPFPTFRFPVNTFNEFEAARVVVRSSLATARVGSFDPVPFSVQVKSVPDPKVVVPISVVSKEIAILFDVPSVSIPLFDPATVKVSPWTIGSDPLSPAAVNRVPVN